MTEAKTETNKATEIEDETGEYIEMADIKNEDEEEEDKLVIDKIQPITSSTQMNEEMVDDGSGFTPTSVTTFYSPLVEVEEMVRRCNTPRIVNLGGQ